MDLNDKRILLTGGAGFLGRHVAKQLVLQGAKPKHITIPRRPSSFNDEEAKASQYDMVRQDLLSKEYCKDAVSGKDIVIHCAGNVGGIGKNQREPGRLLYDNLLMGVQLMEAARKEGVGKFVTIGTICSYPKHTDVPFREDDLWTGYPEDTNAPYGLAKKMLLVQGQAYRQQYEMNVIHLLPVNLYGPWDNFHPESSHVIPALIRRIDEAIKHGTRSITNWGSGNASREFLYVEDAAEGIVEATKHYDATAPVNLGSGKEITVRKLYQTLRTIMGYNGRCRWDTTKPDGQPRRCLEISRALQAFDWQATTDFRQGLRYTVDWYRSNIAPAA